MKIGIIGGGTAGLIATWLLQENFEVLLFEKLDRLGGHARTEHIDINGKKVPIDIGFEFFNQFTFPYLYKLLKILNVSTKDYQLTYTYHTSDKNYLLGLPPFQKNKTYWADFYPSNLFNLFQFKHFINKARSFIKTKNTSITLEQFADTLFLTQHFRDTFLYPFLGAGWGDSLEEFRTFSAYDILSWLVINEPSRTHNNLWTEVVGGTSNYIDALAQQLVNTEINLSTTITNIKHVVDGYEIILPNQTNVKIDHLIIATNAYQAANILSGGNISHELVTALKKIEYFPTTIAIHGDTSLMPKDKSYWSVANVYFDGTYSNLTVYKPWKSNIPIFRSWITPNIAQFNPPTPLYATQHFYHPKVNSNYFEAQKVIKKYQGTNNIWLAGIYTNGIDSHESAIISAINIAKKLAPNSQRLKNLVE